MIRRSRRRQGPAQQGLEVLGRSVLPSSFFSCLPPPGVQRAVTIFLRDNRRPIFLILQDGLFPFFLLSPLVLLLPEKRSASIEVFSSRVSSAVGYSREIAGDGASHWLAQGRTPLGHFVRSMT